MITHVSDGRIEAHAADGGSYICLDLPDGVSMSTRPLLIPVIRRAGRAAERPKPGGFVLRA